MKKSSVMPCLLFAMVITSCTASSDVVSSETENVVSISETMAKNEKETYENTDISETLSKEQNYIFDFGRYSIEKILKINTNNANFLNYYNENLDLVNSVDIYLEDNFFAIKGDLKGAAVVGTELPANGTLTADYEMYYPVFTELDSTPFEYDGILMDNELYHLYSDTSTDLYSEYSNMTGECNLAEYNEVKRYYLGGFKYGTEGNSFYDSDTIIEYYIYVMDDEPYLICYIKNTESGSEDQDALFYVVKLHYEGAVDYEIEIPDMIETPDAADSRLLKDDHSNDALTEDDFNAPLLLAEGDLQTGIYGIKNFLILSDTFGISLQEALLLEETSVNSEITVSDGYISWTCNGGAAWLEESIWFTSAQEGKYYWGVQCPLYLCCDEMMIDDGDALSDSYQSYSLTTYENINRYHLDRKNIGYTMYGHWYETEYRMHMYIMDGKIYLVSYHENMVDGNTYESMYDFVVELELK